jgi:hypothetical protein
MTTTRDKTKHTTTRHRSGVKEKVGSQVAISIRLTPETPPLSSKEHNSSTNKPPFENTNLDNTKPENLKSWSMILTRSVSFNYQLPILSLN